jgi:hypothetical protein
LHQFSDEILQLLGFQVTATPVGHSNYCGSNNDEG